MFCSFCLHGSLEDEGMGHVHMPRTRLRIQSIRPLSPQPQLLELDRRSLVPIAAGNDVHLPRQPEKITACLTHNVDASGNRALSSSQPVRQSLVETITSSSIFRTELFGT